VTHGPQLRLVRELVETLPRLLGRGERQPRRDGADPVVLCSVGEELVGIGVGAGALDEDRARDVARVEQWRELLGLERPGDRTERAGQPGLWRPLEVPQVMVCVDDQEGITRDRFSAQIGSLPGTFACLRGDTVEIRLFDPTFIRDRRRSVRG
jgi:hypothetical protein